MRANNDRRVQRLLATLTLFTAQYATTANAEPLLQRPPHSASAALVSRNIVDAPKSDAYDFVIVGGGTAGLALASRLSENSSVSVLVLEAGKSGDEVRSQIDYPQSTYYESFVGTDYDWQYFTEPQPNGGNRPFQWPRGKVLGGSTAINGMYMTRPNKIEMDAWKGLMSSEDSSAASRWGYDAVAAAIKKSETFHTPAAEVASAAKITFVESQHGTSGPVHISYPAVTRPIVGAWIPSLEAVGVAARDDPATGNNEGGWISTVSTNAANWTRSYARAAYIDPLPPRSNLEIIAGVTVTRITFDSGSPPTATGVEYAASADAAKKTIKVKKEVIMSAGAVGTPQILMVSGVGPKDVVTAAGVTSVHDLAGVGHHLQDHAKAGILFKANGETAGDVHVASTNEHNTAEFRSYISSAVGYVNLSGIIGSDGAAAVKSTATGQRDASASSVPSGSSEVVEGYKSIYDVVTSLFSSTAPQVELLMTDMFPGTVTLQAAIQHPLSAGRLYINSSSVFNYPVIDPQYLVHETDRAILREALKLVRRIGQSDPLKGFLGEETTPGSSVNSDEEWDSWIAQNSVTEYHPCCTSAMLPRSKGGVVDANLKVYGLNNVRVVDASVFPFSFSTHLMTSVYGLAEEAAEIIQAQYNPSSSSSSSSNSQSNSSSSGSTTPNSAVVSSSSNLALWTMILLATMLSLSL